MSETDLSFSSLGWHSPSESTESSSTPSMLSLSSSSLRFGRMDMITDAKSLRVFQLSVKPERLQTQRMRRAVPVFIKTSSNSLVIHFT